MRNLKQHLISKATAAVIALLFGLGLGLAGMARSNSASLVPTVSAQSQDIFAHRTNNFPRTRTCSLGSIQGRYADQASASVIPGGFAPTACAGIVTFDSNGHLTAEEMHSFNGFIVQGHYKGTYTINADCSGEMSLTAIGGPVDGLVSTQHFVVTEDNKEIIYVVTDEGVVSSGTMKKM